MSELSDKMGDSRAQRAMDGELTAEDREAIRREQAEAGHGDPESGPLGKDSDVAEAADMGSGDGLGADPDRLDRAEGEGRR